MKLKIARLYPLWRKSADQLNEHLSAIKDPIEAAFIEGAIVAMKGCSSDLLAEVTSVAYQETHEQPVSQPASDKERSSAVKRALEVLAAFEDQDLNEGAA